jgi:threonine dehydrogenase-like Zn-dependent dehydrogenase
LILRSWNWHVSLERDLAVDSGALPEASATFSEGHGVDAVIITASTKDNGPIEVAGAIARKKGRVVVVGCRRHECAA